MTVNTTERLNALLEQAKRDAKENYSIYHSYRRMVEELNLSPKEFEQAIRQLSKILGV